MLLFIWLILCFTACFSENNTAILWSDRPEFAFYAEYYNAAQTQYKIEMRYYDYLSQKLAEIAPKNGSAYPDIVAGSWLKSASTRVFFRPLDKYFKDVLENDPFYPSLLTLGNIDGNQYLLPVSYNAPLVIFSRNRSGQLSNPFTVGFTEMKTLGKNYNAVTRGIYTRMGFSPTWDDNFLYITAELFNASFREDDPLAWNAVELERAMNFAYEWTNEANTGIQAVDDFTFKYFYEPPAKLAESGRILFTCMDSDVYFTIAEDQRRNLDFRWLAEKNTIPLAERSVYIGLTIKGKSPKAAEAFLRWFIRTDTQRYILEKSRQNRMDETSFGIGGGFSAVRTVTEQVFPLFYPDMLGHMPPQEFLSPANILPSNWITLKERVVLPYLNDRARQPNSRDIIPLERRITDWQRINR
jgi:ABC-type glycerol-3-phosphate transport system substrate-binding protein